MKNLLFLSLIFFGFGLNAQTPFSTSRAIYHAKHRLPMLQSCNGKNTLHFNNTQSIFIHNNYPVENDMVEEGNMAYRIMGDFEGMSVFIDLNQNVQYSKVTGLLGLCMLLEKPDSIDWIINYQEQKKIKEFTCVKASGTFEGREYDVWFTPDIPVPFGPYKLCGLPGLILEAKSRDGKVSWEFVGYESVSTEPVKLKPPVNGKLFTWEEYVQAMINFKLQRESKSNEQFTITISDSPPGSTIEVGKYNIYERYLTTQNKQ